MTRSLVSLAVLVLAGSAVPALASGPTSVPQGVRSPAPKLSCVTEVSGILCRAAKIQVRYNPTTNVATVSKVKPFQSYAPVLPYGGRGVSTAFSFQSMSPGAVPASLVVRSRYSHTKGNGFRVYADGRILAFGSVTWRSI